MIQNLGAANQNAFIPYSAQLVQQQYLWNKGKTSDEDVAKAFGTSVKDFHRKIKDAIKRKYLKNLKSGDKNFDVNIERDGTVTLKGNSTGKEYKTKKTPNEIKLELKLK